MPGCTTLTLTVKPGAERWAPTQRQVADLCRLLSRSVEIEIWHRRDLPRVWAREYEGRSLPVGPYAFRAWTRGDRTFVFVDETETPESTLWLLLHELAHADLRASRLLCVTYRSLPKPPGYLTTDEGHEAHPEEQMANRVANTLAPRLGGRAGLDRLWWRERAPRGSAVRYGRQTLRERYEREIGRPLSERSTRPRTIPATGSTRACYRYVDFLRLYEPETYSRELYAVYEGASSKLADECVLILRQMMKERAGDLGISTRDIKRNFLVTVKEHGLPSSHV